MSQKSDRKKRTPAVIKTSMPDSTLVIRLAVASVIFAVALSRKMPDGRGIMLLVLSAAGAG